MPNPPVPSPRSSLAAAALACLLAACGTEEELSRPRLLDADLRMDNLANPGFSPGVDTWRGDTLIVFDYFALSHEPDFQVVGRPGDGGLRIEYRAVSEESRDWSPPVEARLEILVPAGQDSLRVAFQPVSFARRPDPEGKSDIEARAGVEDAQVERIHVFVRPRSGDR